MYIWLNGRVIRTKAETEPIHRAGYLLRLTMETYIDLLNDENSLSIYHLSSNGLALTVYQIILAYPKVTVFQSLAFGHLQTPLNPVNPVTPVKSFLLTVTSHDSTYRTKSIEMTRYDQISLADMSCCNWQSPTISTR